MLLRQHIFATFTTGGIFTGAHIFSGQTNTQAGPGAPHRVFSRWLEALDLRCEGQCENALRDKALGRTHASHLYVLIFRSSSSADLALEDACISFQNMGVVLM